MHEDAVKNSQRKLTKRQGKRILPFFEIFVGVIVNKCMHANAITASKLYSPRLHVGGDRTRYQKRLRKAQLIY